MNKEIQPSGRRAQGELFNALQKRFREKRFAKVHELIKSLLDKKDNIHILDVGGRAEYWNMLDPQFRDRVRLTILNYDAELSIYSKAVDESLKFEHAVGNACDMPEFADGSFDLVHSNSVIEHVGSYANMASFAREIGRVGQSYYVQTPNFWFPIDPHTAFPFLHWLPDPIRLFAHTHLSLGMAKKSDFTGATSRMDGCRMISRAYMRALFPDAAHSSERIALIFAKSLIATREG